MLKYKFMKYVKWKYINYNTSLFVDTTFIIFNFDFECDIMCAEHDCNLNEIENSDEFKNYISDMEKVGNDLINYIQMIKFKNKPH